MNTDHLVLPKNRIEYMRALIDATEMGANKALEAAGLLKPYLTEREAKRKYGPTIVNRWIKESLVKVIKDGDGTASKRIDRLQIEAVAKSANRSTFLTTKER
jgi:hypothetical protein